MSWRGRGRWEAGRLHARGEVGEGGVVDGRAACAWSGGLGRLGWQGFGEDVEEEGGEGDDGGRVVGVVGKGGFVVGGGFEGEGAGGGEVAFLLRGVSLCLCVKRGCY